jgi:Ca2+-binding RTX toxin-like protein
MTDYTGTILYPNGTVTEHVRLRGDSQYIIDLKGSREPGSLSDPSLSIIGENGEFAEDNNGGRGRASQIAFTPNKTQYFDVIVSGASRSTGDYVLTIHRDDFRNVVVGSAPAGTMSTDGRSRAGIVNYEDDVDVFELSLIKGLTYGLRMLARPTEEDQIDPRLTLLSERGRQIMRDDDFESENQSYISYTAERTGSYWLRAEDSGGDTGSYVVRAGIGQGTQLGDQVRGGEAGDWINVLGGNDALRGGAGDDRLWGASGDDTLAGEDGSDRVLGGVGRDSMDGGLGSDDLFGEDDRDILEGGEGNDSLNGGEGNDVAGGGLGRDAIQGGLGDDRLDGAEGGDSIDGGDGDDVAIGGSGQDYVSGGLGADRLRGDDGSDQLYGGDENDRLYGGAGGDYLIGEDGDDRIAGGFDDDYIEGGDGEDRISGGEGDDYLEGGSENDLMLGGVGKDTLSGSDEQDVLNGGEDGDLLYGGGESDLFLFTISTDSLIEDPDVIEEFDQPGSVEGDIIDLSAIDADWRTAGNQAFLFGEDAARGTVWLENGKARSTFVYFSTNDDPEPEFMLRISDGRGVRAEDYSEADFVL